MTGANPSFEVLLLLASQAGVFRGASILSLSTSSPKNACLGGDIFTSLCTFFSLERGKPKDITKNIAKEVEFTAPSSLAR